MNLTSPGRFFDRQTVARRRTLQIMLLFPWSLMSVAMAFHALYFLYTIFSMQWVFMEDPVASPYRPERIASIHILTVLVVLFGMVRAWRNLSIGGVAVARRLGGRPADPASSHPGEKRWINVVEEMALAARIPTPHIYILDAYHSINALAAGYTPRDAVVAITRGGLEWLTRDELQGIAAHEIGHIANGDTRLNMRIMILLAGVQMLPVAGRTLAEKAWSNLNVGGARQGEGVALLGILVGYAMWFLGSLALFFNRLIQAAVSRQREYLADASAIQFSRNPQGLSQALQKIGGLSSGSRIRDPRCEEYRHFYFSQTSAPSIFDWIDTHPPLLERIRLLDPGYSGTFPKLIQGRWYGLNGSDTPHPQPTDAALATRGKGGNEGVALADAMLEAGQIVTEVHRNLVRALAQSETNVSLFHALLIGASSDQDQAIAFLSRSESESRVKTTEQLLPLLANTDPAAQLALVRLSTMALAGLNQNDRTNLLATVKSLIRLDRKISLVEYSMEKIVQSTLAPEAFKVPGHRRVSTFRKHAKPLSICLSLTARVGGDPPAEAFARGIKALGLGKNHGCQLEPASACGLEAMDRALHELTSLSDEHLRTLVQAIHATLPMNTPPTLNALWLFFVALAMLNQPIPTLFWNQLAASRPSP
ncbi:MAG: M48 family metalloprotease [Magnetococcales bacterium]|nr:M48 family metalloprotease [Magnetococcales bacterium]